MPVTPPTKPGAYHVKFNDYWYIGIYNIKYGLFEIPQPTKKGYARLRPDEMDAISGPIDPVPPEEREATPAQPANREAEIEALAEKLYIARANDNDTRLDDAFNNAEAFYKYREARRAAGK